MQGARENKKVSASGIIGRLSIKRKIVLIIMIVSLTAMILAGGTFITYEWFSFREHMVNDISVQATMLADNSIGALSFDDPKDAEEVLQSLRAKKPIVFACVYRSDGAVFATYRQERFSPDITPPEPQEDGYSFDSNSLVIFKRVILDNRPIGTVYLQSDLSEMSTFMKQSVAALTLMLMLSSIAAYALSSKFQKVISMPIISLAETAGKVTMKKDYSLRAEKKSEDEVGNLIDSFNDMLAQIQQRDNDLQESENRYRTLFESANDAIFIMKDALFIDCNQKTLEMFGCSLEQIVNQPPYMFSPLMQPDSRRSREKALEKIEAAYNGNPQFFEWKHQKYDGTLFDAEVSLNSIELGPIRFLQAIVRDITERKRAEERLIEYQDHLEDLVKVRTEDLEMANEKLKELDKLKSMFIASMSHELRTPLNSIIGFTGIILQGMVGSINEEQRDQLQRVYGSAKHLLNLISDVIDISKVEAGKVEAYIEEVQLEKIIDEAVSSLKTQIDAKKLDLEINVSQGVKMNTDNRRLLQCILNILSNAVKFTEQGKIVIATSENNGMIEIKVEDTGIGIAEKDISRLFNSFVRLDSHLKTVTPGTGLGLYLTKKLAAEILGGSVSVESDYGKGSRFILRIPKEIAAV